MQNYQNFTTIIEKKNKPFFVIFALLMLLGIAGLFQLKLNPDMMIFMPNKSEAKNSFDKMNGVFKSGDEMLIVLHTQKDSLDESTSNSIVALSDTLKSLPGVAYVISPVMNGEIKDSGFMSEISSLIRHDGKWEVFMSVVADSNLSRKQVKHIELLINDTGMTYDISGTSFLQKRLIDFIIQILFYLPFLAIGLIFFVFRMQMRSFKATFMSVLPAVIGALWTLGLAGWIGGKVSIITAIAPIFTIIIGSADGLHFVSHYLDARAKGEEKKKAVGSTLALVGIPMIITTITSIGGFLSLLLMDTNAVRELAIFTSTGIAFAGLATWFILPLFLINKVSFKAERTKPRISGEGLKKLWGWPALVITIIIIVVSIFGYSKVKTDFNQLSMFKKSTDVYQSAEAITEIHGGSMPSYVFIQHNNDILDKKLKTEISQFTDSLSQYGKVISPYDVVDGILSQPMMRMLRMMSSDQKIIFDLIAQEDIPLGHMLNLEQNAAKITILPSEIHHESLSAMKQLVSDIQIPNTSIAITGMSFIMDELNQNMVNNLKNTLIMALGIMFVLLLITFKKIVPVLISLIPILVTSLFLYGFLGLSGMSLTVMTAMIFSITVGIGVDYAIHLTSVALKLQDINLAFNYAARPIMTNAIGLAIGMTALMTTPLTLHVHISIMMWISMILSMFLSLSLLPTLLKVYLKKN
ncbi:MAG: MMPL family transporter [Candidatus Marinimicrobia bacterium]|nr:MMPL family transporter [Candidatus Neomarinimicrobiota bacterium]